MARNYGGHPRPRRVDFSSLFVNGRGVPRTREEQEREWQCKCPPFGEIRKDCPVLDIHIKDGHKVS